IKIKTKNKEKNKVARITTTVKTEKLTEALEKQHKHMQPYTEIITNKDTIDKATHIFAPKSPKGQKSYHTIYNHISVDTMNSILFNDSVVVRSSRSGSVTYNNNTG